MTKQRRPRNDRSDPIRDLQEWQNHQYDPGYWSNLGRLRGGYPGAGRMLLISVGVIWH